MRNFSRILQFFSKTFAKVFFPSWNGISLQDHSKPHSCMVWTAAFNRNPVPTRLAKRISLKSSKMFLKWWVFPSFQSQSFYANRCKFMQHIAKESSVANGKKEFKKCGIRIISQLQAVTSAIDLRNKFDAVKSVLANSSEDWNKRQTQLKTIRSIIIHGEKLVDRAQMIAHVLQLLGCFELAVKDLRSQILREAAITCSFIISKYGIEVHSIGEDILSAAMGQVAVSTKIMATSASTLTEFIVEVHLMLVTLQNDSTFFSTFKPDKCSRPSPRSPLPKTNHKEDSWPVCSR